MMKRYGDAGDKWPVQKNEVWRCGLHTFACIDLSSPHGVSILDTVVLGAIRPPRLAYTDPPWTPGIANGYRTKAGLTDKYPYDTLLDAILKAMKPAELGFIEIGLKNEGALALACQNAGIPIQKAWDITYYGNRPARLLALHLHKSTTFELADFTGMDDAATPGFAIERHSIPGDVILDPCVGQGLTALWAQHHGCYCVGSELHPRRLAVTLEKLRLVGAGEPEKIR